jgi:hypothetical protein
MNAVAGRPSVIDFDDHYQQIHETLIHPCPDLMPCSTCADESVVLAPFPEETRVVSRHKGAENRPITNPIEIMIPLCHIHSVPPLAKEAESSCGLG